MYVSRSAKHISVLIKGYTCDLVKQKLMNCVCASTLHVLCSYSGSYIRMYISTYMYMYMRMCLCTCVCAYIRMYVSTYIYVYMYIHVCMYKCLSQSICTTCGGAIALLTGTDYLSPEDYIRTFTDMLAKVMERYRINILLFHHCSAWTRTLVHSVIG